MSKEQIVNVPLDPAIRNGLAEIADDAGRADCRQAAEYIKDGVKRDLARKAKK